MKHLLMEVLYNPIKYKHHKHLIDRLIKVNILMSNLEVSDKGGTIVRDYEEHSYMNDTLKLIIKKG